MTDQQEAPIEKFTTSCKSCVFAEYEGTMQRGCGLGRLDTFLEQGRATRHNRDADVSHYIIDGICNASRGKEWSVRNATCNLEATVEREVQITMDFVLFSVDEDHTTLIKRVERAVSSCVKQETIKPKSIVLVIKNSASIFQELYGAVQELTEPYGVPFQLVRVVENDADTGRSLEMGIDKCKSQFVAVFELAGSIPSNIIYRLNQLINYDLARMVMIEPVVGYSGLIIPNNVFKLLGKNYNIPIYEKIREVAEEQDREYMILPWSTL